MRLVKIKNKYMYKDNEKKYKTKAEFVKAQNKIHTYAVHYDWKSKEYRAVQLTHLYQKDYKRFNQLKLGLLLKTRFKNYEVPTGIHNSYYSKDVNGNKLKLKDNDNIVEIEKAHLSKKQALLIKDFAKNKRK